MAFYDGYGNPLASSDSGLTDEVRASMLAVLKKAQYISDVSEDFNVLEANFAVLYIKNNLTNVTSDNSAKSTIAGSEYSTIITPVDGYTITTVTVVMDDVDITDDVYSNGNITIPEVTGNVIITAVAYGVSASISSDYNLRTIYADAGSNVLYKQNTNARNRYANVTFDADKDVFIKVTNTQSASNIYAGSWDGGDNVYYGKLIPIDDTSNSGSITVNIKKGYKPFVAVISGAISHVVEMYY